MNDSDAILTDNLLAIEQVRINQDKLKRIEAEFQRLGPTMTPVQLYNLIPDALLIARDAQNGLLAALEQVGNVLKANH